MRWPLAPGCLALALVTSPAAAAEPTPIALVYEAPPDCPAAIEFLGSVQARTSRVRAAAPEEVTNATVVQVTIGGDARGSWGSLMLIESGVVTGRRRVEGESCQEIVDALALATALSLDPTALLGPEPPANAPPPETAAPAPPPEPEAPARTPRSRPKPERPYLLRLGTAAIVAEPLAPMPFWGGMAEVGVARGRRGPAAALAFGFALGDGDHARFSWQVARLTLHPLRAPLGRITEVGVGLASEVGALHAEGEGLDTTRTVTRGYWSAGLDGRLEITLHPGLVASLAAGLGLPGTDRRFTIGDPPREIASSPALVPLVAVGIGARLPAGSGARTARNDHFRAPRASVGGSGVAEPNHLVR